MKESKYKPKTFVLVTEYIQDGVAYKTRISSDYEDAELDPSVSLPGYQRAIALGNPATTLRSGIKERLRTDEWNTTNVWKAGPFSTPVFQRSRGKDEWPGVGRTRFMSYDPSVASAASAQFQARGADAAHQFDGGQFFGEFMQTVRLVSSPFKAIAKLATQHKGRVVRAIGKSPYSSLSRKKKRNVQKEVYNSYLEFTFGVKPLLSDADAAVNTLIEASRRNIHVPVHGRHQETRLVSETWATANADENVSFVDVFRHTTVKATFSCEIVGAILIVNGNNAIENVANNSGFGLDNFLPTVYNLIPFSFLVDYVSNLGDIIQATSAYRLNHAWSNTTERIDVSADSVLVSFPSGTVPPGASNSYTINGGAMHLDSVRWKRQGGYPVVDLQALKFEFPSAHQLLNVGAIIGSLHQSGSIAR